jgi:hypothetical protein
MQYERDNERQPEDWCMEDDSPVTLGIGVICEGGKYVVLASDTRASYGDPDASGIAPNDRIGKQWDFHPFKLVASVAGQLGTAHNVVSQLTIELEKLVTLQESGTTLCREHIENAIDEARIHETGRRYNSASRLYFHVTLQQLLRGKLNHGTIDKYAWTEMKKIVFGLPLPVEMIIGGFLADEPILMKASGKRHTETDSDPPVFVIGSKGSGLAMEHLNKRGQHIFSGLAQSLLHIHEAAEIARSADKYIGLCPGYIVMGTDFKGFGQIEHNSSCLTGWASAYKDRHTTDSLNNNISREQAIRCMKVLPPGKRFIRKQAP